MPKQSFISELKRRQVVRVALVYGAVSFAVLQAADIIVPRLQLPDWIVTLVLVLALLGFPIALVLGWAFELTPEGVRRTESGPGDELAASAPGKHAWLAPRTVLAALILVTIGLLAGWLLRPDGNGDDATGIDELPSLAVLPLENVGGDVANNSFAVGLHDDLLTQLSKIDGVRLVSRTSVREYANTTKNIRDIATELGVGNILEGSVQRAANQVRINVQLIEASTDRHLWAETYDQDLTVANLFAIQAEIAGAIARALSTELTGATRKEIARPPTDNLAAYDAYLRGLAAGFWDYGPTAGEAFAEAARLDPTFAAAHAGEARARSWLARVSFQQANIPYARQMAQEARDAAARAAALAPDAPEARLAQGYVAYYVDWNLDVALARFREVEAVRRNDAEVAVAIGLILRRLGRWDEALGEFKRAMALAPRDEVGFYESGETYLNLGRFDEALRHALLALQLHPGEPDAVEVTIRAYAGKGDTTSLRRFLERDQPWNDEDLPDPWLFVPHGREGMAQRLRDNLKNRSERPLPLVYWAAMRWARMLGQPAVVRVYADSMLALTQPALRAMDQTADARVRSSQHRLTAIALAYRGDADESIRHARRAVELVPFELDAIEGWDARNSLLEVLIVTGRLDEAVVAARELVRPPSPFSIARLKVDPLTTPLRNHPEFQRLVNR